MENSTIKNKSRERSKSPNDGAIPSFSEKLLFNNIQESDSKKKITIEKNENYS